MTPAIQARAFPKRWAEQVWERRDVAAIDDLVAEEFVLHDPQEPEPIHGREPVREFVGMVLSAFPDLSVDVEDVVAEGDRAAVRMTASGTHEGEFMGVEPTGEYMEGSIMAIQRIEDGTLVEEWQVADHLDMFQQLGVVELPEA